MSSSFFSTTPKELWCFACNSMKITCLHECCPEHCNMCDRIKAYENKGNGITTCIRTFLSCMLTYARAPHIKPDSLNAKVKHSWSNRYDNDQNTSLRMSSRTNT